PTPSRTPPRPRGATGPSAPAAQPGTAPAALACSSLHPPKDWSLRITRGGSPFTGVFGHRFRFGLGLVVPGWVEDEVSDGFAVGCGDPHVEVLDQYEDFRAGVSAADADVVQGAARADRELAAGVDGVVADSVVRVVEGLCSRGGLGSALVGGSWRSPAQGAVGANVVVVAAERVELRLQFDDGGGAGVAGLPLLLPLVKQAHP